MSITSKDLKELSEAATQGEWVVDHNHLTGSDIIMTDCDDGVFISADVCTQSSEFIVSAVNGIRSGQLVHVDDIDEQELLDEMRAERDEAREEVEKLREADTPAKPRVKPLVWEEDEPWRHRGMPTVKLGGFCFNVMQHGMGYWYVAGQSERHENLEAAKSAAEAIFECRVLSMLEDARAALSQGEG